jgi:hypothetical protein
VPHSSEEIISLKGLPQTLGAMWQQLFGAEILGGLFGDEQDLHLAKSRTQSLRDFDSVSGLEDRFDYEQVNWAHAAFYNVFHVGHRAGFQHSVARGPQKLGEYASVSMVIVDQKNRSHVVGFQAIRAGSVSRCFATFVLAGLPQAPLGINPRRVSQPSSLAQDHVLITDFASIQPRRA